MASASRSHARELHTAGCIIIGDEVLNGKTVDTNGPYFAKFCFRLGLSLRRIEVIGDTEEEIIEATTRMSNKFDFVVTSGGIGPTHDDITYQSIAKGFGLPLHLHQAAFDRMKQLAKPHPSQPNFSYEEPSPALTAKKRMVELPYDDKIKDEDQVLFVQDDLWVPINVVNGNVHILPGVPRLFTRLVDGMRPLLEPRVTDPEGQGLHRIWFATPLAESAAAGYLTELAAKVEPRGVKVGSYPRWGEKRNTVTLVGRDKEYMESLVDEVALGVQGERIDGESDEERT